MKDTSTGGIENEIEGGSQGKESDKVQGFVRLLRDVGFRCFGSLREGTMREEPSAGGEQEDYEKGDCESSQSLPNKAKA